MKRFLTRSLLYVLVVLAVMAVCEAIVRHYPNSYSLKAAWVDAHAPQVRTLVLGSSHNYYGIEPRLLGDDAFNLANVSQSPEYDWFLLQKYYGSDCHRLRNVIIAVDFTPLFNGPLEDGDEWWRAIYYHIYMGCNKHSMLSRYGFEWCCLSRFNTKFGAAMRYLVTGKASLNCDSAGFGLATTPPEMVTPEHMKETADVVFRHYQGINVDYVAYNVRYLELIADFCQRNGVNMIVVSTPLWPAYYERIGAQELAIIGSTYDLLRQRGALCHDYSHDTRFDGIENFSDCSHLSRVGAERFTQQLLVDFPQLR